MSTAPRSHRDYSDADKACALAVLSAAGGNLRRAAAETGIARTTLRNWSTGAHGVTPEIAVEVAVQRADLATRLEARIDVLVDSLTDDKIHASNAVQIATTIAILVDKVRLLRADIQPPREAIAEIIRRHINDPETLGKIAADLDAAFSTGGVRSAH